MHCKLTTFFFFVFLSFCFSFVFFCGEGGGGAGWLQGGVQWQYGKSLTLR